MRLPVLACMTLMAIASGATAREATLDARQATYELRIYYPAPGKLAALNARFRNSTVKLFAKHGMRNVAYWNEQPTTAAPDGRVIYVLAYPSRAAREQSWKMFAQDPDWRKVVTQSEAGGRLVAKVDSTFMSMTDYSPVLKLPD